MTHKHTHTHGPSKTLIGTWTDRQSLFTHMHTDHPWLCVFLNTHIAHFMSHQTHELHTCINTQVCVFSNKRASDQLKHHTLMFDVTFLSSCKKKIKKLKIVLRPFFSVQEKVDPCRFSSVGGDAGSLHQGTG